MYVMPLMITSTAGGNVVIIVSPPGSSVIVAPSEVMMVEAVIGIAGNVIPLSMMKDPPIAFILLPVVLLLAPII
jgi:hypothetical protein